MRNELLNTYISGLDVLVIAFATTLSILTFLLWMRNLNRMHIMARLFVNPQLILFIPLVIGVLLEKTEIGCYIMISFNLVFFIALFLTVSNLKFRTLVRQVLICLGM